jgi:Complex I intermediate-associated protein 30 (CIA30).
MDDQERFDSTIVNGVSFTLKDDVDGPFALEVDEIGLVNMPEVTDDNFDYESYILPEPGFNQKM